MNTVQQEAEKRAASFVSCFFKTKATKDNLANWLAGMYGYGYTLSHANSELPQALPHVLAIQKIKPVLDNISRVSKGKLNTKSLIEYFSHVGNLGKIHKHNKVQAIAKGYTAGTGIAEIRGEVDQALVERMRSEFQKSFVGQKVAWKTPVFKRAGEYVDVKVNLPEIPFGTKQKLPE